MSNEAEEILEYLASSYSGAKMMGDVDCMNRLSHAIAAFKGTDTQEPVIHCRIRLRGCDDDTEFVIECTKEQYEFLETIANKSRETSTYGCMPDMWIYETKPCIHTSNGWCYRDDCVCESCWYTVE